MEVLTIHGGHKLSGSIRMPGAKNSVLPLMAASVLCDTPVTLSDVPDLSDVRASVRILQSIGCAAEYRDKTVRILSTECTASEIGKSLMQTMRSSLLYLAPILARTGRAQISMPGGCRLGKRPIDLHLSGLARMGAHISESASGMVELTAPDGLRGTDFTLYFPSVGATETLLMAACTAKGQTILRGAACEPEVTELARFLQKAGAHITGIGTKILNIRGGTPLSGVHHTVCPDRITAATVLCAVAACGGEVLLTNTKREEIAPVLKLLQKAGCVSAFIGPDGTALASSGKLCGAGAWKTGVYPEFPTDAAPLAASALLQAEGASIVEDTIFENRFACAGEWKRMGASVFVSGQTLHITGSPMLKGAEMTVPDLRGGAALVIAALQASGKSVIRDAGHLARGYEDIAGLFAQLGAQMKSAGDSKAAG